MSYIHALAAACEGERHRFLSGGDRGIVKAIATRDRDSLTAEDYEWATRIIARALEMERRSMEDGRTEHAAFEERAHQLAAGHTLAALQLEHARITGIRHDPREFTGTGTRRSGAAVTNEAHRYSWEHSRVYARAIEIKEAK